MSTSSKASLARKLLSKDGGAGLSNLFMAKAIYNYALDGGAAALITPKQNVEIPDNAVIVAGTINSTAALGTATSANVTIGLSAGGAGAAALLGTTAHTSLSADAVLNAVPVFATPIKMTAKGNITLTPSAALTAGVIEVTLFYFVANA